MTRIILLEQLKAFTENSIRDIIMPVKRQENDREEPKPRTAEVHLMRLIKGTSAKKAAPYIIHQVITGRDYQGQGEPAKGQTVVRSIFGVYSEDEQEGSLMLLGLIEKLRFDLLETVIIGNQFQLNLEAGLEMLIYPDDTAPYYVGEMISTWHIPGIKRKVDLYGK